MTSRRRESRSIAITRTIWPGCSGPLSLKRRLRNKHGRGTRSCRNQLGYRQELVGAGPLPEDQSAEGDRPLSGRYRCPNHGITPMAASHAGRQQGSKTEVNLSTPSTRSGSPSTRRSGSISPNRTSGDSSSRRRSRRSRGRGRPTGPSAMDRITPPSRFDFARRSRGRREGLSAHPATTSITSRHFLGDSASRMNDLVLDGTRFGGPYINGPSTSRGPTSTGRQPADAPRPAEDFPSIQVLPCDG